ncbi:T9SS type A sorting domain-containing protein [Halocola ammonii]
MSKQLATFIIVFQMSLIVSAQFGDLDMTFNPDDPGFGLGRGFNVSEFEGIEVYDDDRFLVNIELGRFDTTFIRGIARLNVDGTLDTTFSTGNYFSNTRITSMAASEEGDIYVSGSREGYYNESGQYIDPAVVLVKLNPDGSVDSEFEFEMFYQSEIKDLEATSGGVLVSGRLIGSMFSQLSEGTLHHIYSTGQFDSAWPTFNFKRGDDISVAPQVVKKGDDGFIYLGGEFERLNGENIDRFLRLDSDGMVDYSFNESFTIQFDLEGQFPTKNIHDIELMNDGKIAICGTFTGINNSEKPHIAVFFNDGSIDSSFNTNDGFASVGEDVGLGPLVSDIAVTQNNIIVVTGQFNQYNGTPTMRIAGINSDGTLNTGFIHKIQPLNLESGRANLISTVNNYILVGGEFTYFDYGIHPNVVKLGPTGELDHDFIKTKTMNFHARTSDVGPNGKLVAAGIFTHYNGFPVNGIVRLNDDGSRDTTFNTGLGFRRDIGQFSGYTEVDEIEVDWENRVLVVGNFDSFDGDSLAQNVIRLNEDGSLDDSFNVGGGLDGAGFISDFLTSENQKIYCSGSFDTWDSNVSGCLVRLNEDGTFDPTFSVGEGASNRVRTMALQADGKLIIGGDFYFFQGIEQKCIARINTDGSIDTTFTPPSIIPISRVEKIEIDPSGKLWVLGDMELEVSPNQFSSLIVLEPDGNLFTDVTTALNDPNVADFAIDPDGKVTVINEGNSKLSRITLETNGAITSEVSNSEFYGGATQIKRDLNDDYLLLGGFMAYGDIGRCRIARIFSGYEEPVEPLDGDQFIVYPNPSQGQVSVHLSENLVGEELKIFDPTGRLVYSVRFESAFKTLSLHHFRTGLYIFRCQEHSAKVLFE